MNTLFFNFSLLRTKVKFPEYYITSPTHNPFCQFSLQANREKQENTYDTINEAGKQPKVCIKGGKVLVV